MSCGDLLELLKISVHMLHEQAHGKEPFNTCSQEPCNELPLNLVGAAPNHLPLIGE